LDDERTIKKSSHFDDPEDIDLDIHAEEPIQETFVRQNARVQKYIREHLIEDNRTNEELEALDVPDEVIGISGNDFE